MAKVKQDIIYGIQTFQYKYVIVVCNDVSFLA